MFQHRWMYCSLESLNMCFFRIYWWGRSIDANFTWNNILNCKVHHSHIIFFLTLCSFIWIWSLLCVLPPTVGICQGICKELWMKLSGRQCQHFLQQGWIHIGRLCNFVLAMFHHRHSICVCSCFHWKLWLWMDFFFILSVWYIFCLQWSAWRWMV